MNNLLKILAAIAAIPYVLNGLLSLVIGLTLGAAHLSGFLYN